MPRKVAQSKGVVCLETDQWYGQKDRASVEPALHLLEAAAFEALALGQLQSAALTKPSIQEVHRELKRMAPGLCGRLEFRLVVKS